MNESSINIQIRNQSLYSLNDSTTKSSSLSSKSPPNSNNSIKADDVYLQSQQSLTQSEFRRNRITPENITPSIHSGKSSQRPWYTVSTFEEKEDDEKRRKRRR